MFFHIAFGKQNVLPILPETYKKFQAKESMKYHNDIITLTFKLQITQIKLSYKRQYREKTSRGEKNIKHFRLIKSMMKSVV